MENEKLLEILKKERPTLNDVEIAFKEYERRIGILEKINSRIDSETKKTPLNELLKNRFRDPLKYEEAQNFSMEELFKNLLETDEYETIAESLDIVEKWDDGKLKRKWYEFKIDMKKGLPEIAVERIMDYLKTCEMTPQNVGIFYDTALELETVNDMVSAVEIYKNIIKRGITYKDVVERYKNLKQTDSSHFKTPTGSQKTPTGGTPDKTPFSN